jgi:ABC-type nickel/cobalt efflux system permease component RcnA
MEDQQQLLDHHHHHQQQEVQKHEQEQVQQQEDHKEQEQQEQAQEEQKEEQEQQSQLLSLPCTALLPALPAAVTSLLAVDRCGASALGTVVQAHRGLAAALSRLALLEQALQDKESLLQESRAMVRVCMC